MAIRKYEVWVADLNPRFGTEPGKRRPVVVLQTDLLNEIEHPSTLICPITTKSNDGSSILRILISEGEAGLNSECHILVDQVRAIDNKRFVKRVGVLDSAKRERLDRNLAIIFDLV